MLNKRRVKQIQSTAKSFEHLRYNVPKNSYLTQFYEINICQVIIFRLYDIYNKHEMTIKPEKNHKYYRKCSTNFAVDSSLYRIGSKIWYRRFKISHKCSWWLTLYTKATVQSLRNKLQIIMKPDFCKQLLHLHQNQLKLSILENAEMCKWKMKLSVITCTWGIQHHQVTTFVTIIETSVLGPKKHSIYLISICLFFDW